MIWKKFIDLSNKHITGYVWTYDDFHEVLRTLLSEGRLILGGDILDISCNGEINYADGSGWYYEGDSFAESNTVAEKYLNSIKEWAKKEKLFVAFVLKDTMLIELMLKNLKLNI